jgi:class 3 adenylate cyclase
MRVGFGEAGADIIGKNLNITTGADSINLLGNGRKIQSIFGFCDVRQFTDTTECLQEEVMLFVNRIAHILHSIVVQCDGAANKNIGDAFLLTWKVQANSIASVKDHKYAADKALYSFIKTMIEMSRHEDFLCNFSPRALSELYERMPGYKCRIGCGLHFGWAIEGAIGSSKKIDASYISPHVNMTETLESSTKEYGVPLLMSEPFYNLLSPEAAADCRKVDVLDIGKSGKAVGLYTYDVDLSVGFTIEREKPTKNGPKSSKRHFTLVGDVKKEAHSVRVMLSINSF